MKHDYSKRKRNWSCLELEGVDLSKCKTQSRKFETLTLKPSHIRRGDAFSKDSLVSGLRSAGVSTNIVNVARAVVSRKADKD